MSDKDYAVRSAVIRHERLRKRWTQEDLARTSGLSLGQVSRIENGKIPAPHFATIRKIAEALEVGEEELIEWPLGPGGPPPGHAERRRSQNGAEHQASLA